MTRIIKVSMTRIVKVKRYQGILLMALFACVVAGEAYAGNLYRYTNSRGFVVLDDRLPPEYVSNGYEVLSKSGRLIKVVPAHVDKPEVDAETQEKVDGERQREDKYILASYGSLEDIQQTGARKKKALEREIQIVERNLADTRAQRVEERARAANYQRSGRPVPDLVKDVLAQLEEEENKAIPLLESRRQEQADMKAQYERYEARFVELTGGATEASSTSPETASEPEG